jgi:hypothetical protein
MSANGGGGDEWAFSESKDWKDGRHKRANEWVRSVAGEIEDRDRRKWLEAIELAYQRAYRRGWLSADAPPSVEQLRAYRELRSDGETETFARRVEDGEGGKLRSHVGSQTDEVDVSGWDDIERIRQIAAQQPFMLYIYGEPGTGKTASALKIARHHVDQVDQYVEVGTNIRTAVEQTPRVDRHIPNWDSLKDWMIKDQQTVLEGDVEPKLFIFDEASSHASGGGMDGWETMIKLATLIYKIRKYGGSILIIGHDGKDLHPAVRELCQVLHKTEKESARFYESIKNRSGKDPITPEISGWPDTKWNYEDLDPAPWDWSRKSGEDGGEAASGDITRELAYKEMSIALVVKERQSENPLSHAKIANQKLNGAYSAEWVRKKWKEYEAGHHREIVGIWEDETA